MFNFFDEIKCKMGIKEDSLYDYNIVNISGRLVYVEGHKGIVLLSEKKVIFKTKSEQISVEGSGLVLAELNENVLYIQGKIDKVEKLP
ncbi:MAG: hypothetical protein IJX25_03455 [Clostridia bacterium]|nr:hypothetical protein [Clostridia bacterium]MBQ8792880.1 hypothetical protein [Clostridia bacterium]